MHTPSFPEVPGFCKTVVKLCKICVLTLAVVLMTGRAGAGLIVYEGFDYGDGVDLSSAKYLPNIE